MKSMFAIVGLVLMGCASAVDPVPGTEPVLNEEPAAQYDAGAPEEQADASWFIPTTPIAHPENFRRQPEFKLVPTTPIAHPERFRRETNEQCRVRVCAEQQNECGTIQDSGCRDFVTSQPIDTIDCGSRGPIMGCPGGAWKGACSQPTGTCTLDSTGWCCQ